MREMKLTYVKIGQGTKEKKVSLKATKKNKQGKCCKSPVEVAVDWFEESDK